MTRRTRKMLKEKFQAGKMPSQDDFFDMIESMLNMLDEGFDKNADDGFKVAQVGDHSLMSFYKDIDVGNALWRLALEPGSGNNLSFQDAQKLPVLTLASGQTADGVRQCAVGINNNTPRHELDVAGTIASFARVGQSGNMAVPADSNWYDISDTMTGCQAFEVVAGVGGKDADGKYALMHAFAVNAFNNNGSITYHQAHFGNKCSRIELRWIGSDKQAPFDYKLQMRVGCSYGNDVWIKYHVTRLWQDTLMLESEDPPSQPPRPLPSGSNGKK